ncbi:MAG: PIG-L family deacetylase [Acidobacteria bacterium]|nr:PIG-L family deacetylase [Acidobacteriota bacterium]
MALIALLIITSATRGAAQADTDRAELYQSLLDLTNPWTVMCVAAHPDDEDGATLTVLRRKYGAHTVSLFSTFGEGGQNAIGPELYEELGAIRAGETVKAAEIQGSEAHFLGLKDFGFSKSAEEAFRIWGHDEALRRMVLEIRRLRPDVIITNHDTTGGHGHHQATGRLVLEAFDAAADPKRFPEQMPVVQAWQVQRLFVRMNYEGLAESKKLDQEAERAGKFVVVNRNEQDPVRGMTYAEEALHALQQHASQGPWPQSLPKDGWPPVRYRLAREAEQANPLPANPKTFLDGLQLPEYLQSRMAAPTIDGRPLTEFVDQRERVFNALLAAKKRAVSFDKAVEGNKDRRFHRWSARLDEALLAARGISLNLSTQSDVRVLASSVNLILKLTNKGDKPLTIQSIQFSGFNNTNELKKQFQLSPQSTVTEQSRIKVPAGTETNLPHSLHLYDGRLFGEEVRAIIHLKIDGADLWVGAYSQVDIAPAVEIASLAPTPYIFTPANLNQPLTFRVRLVNHQDKPFKGAFMILQAGQGGEVGPDISLAAHETREITLRTNIIPVDTPDERRTPRADFGSITFSLHAAESANVITQREARVIYTDAQVAPKLRVGYVRSTDDTLRNALEALGVEAQELKAEDVATAELSKFDTIIIDNRGYQLHTELIAANPRLLDFAKNGGTLIVFYHKTNEWNPDAARSRPQLAPLAITLGNERVTDENATITFTEPQHPLLNLPNKITQDDFKDWIQERGLYYPKTWDAGYHALFAMSDAGEEPLRGGLLTLDTGRGHYIYTSMVWYRQLRAGIPGAYRMFANMISYGHTATK